MFVPRMALRTKSFTSIVHKSGTGTASGVLQLLIATTVPILYVEVPPSFGPEFSSRAVWD
jgi:hypothetical protein